MSTTNQQKFENQNRIQQKLIGGFHAKFLDVLAKAQPKSVLELGCGEGYLLTKIAQAYPSIPLLGLDNNQAAVDEGHRIFPKLKLDVGDIYNIAQPDGSWDVVVASEVMEHLEQPIKALEELRRVSSRYVLLSVPHEPWFRLGNFARGRHVRRFGNHPEHINLWSRKSFVTFIRQRLTPISITSAFPWTIVLAQR